MQHDRSLTAYNSVETPENRWIYFDKWLKYHEE